VFENPAGQTDGMRVETATEPGTPGRPNEDFAAAAVGGGPVTALVLLDGVTPPETPPGCGHGVPWFVARLGAALLELSVSHPSRPLAHCLSSAVTRTARAHSDTCDLSHIRTPQATVVLARRSASTLDYLVLSDSRLLLEAPDGTVTVIRDDRLDQLPSPVPELRAAVRALPVGSADRAAATARYVAAVEALRNAPGGFHTAAADPAVAELAVTGSVPAGAVRSVTALSDGAARLVEVFGLTDWAGLVAEVRASGAAGPLARVRAAEAADPAGARFPRGKRSDDATVLFAEAAGDAEVTGTR
jgi:hypothetical protein